MSDISRTPLSHGSAEASSPGWGGADSITKPPCAGPLPSTAAGPGCHHSSDRAACVGPCQAMTGSDSTAPTATTGCSRRLRPSCGWATLLASSTRGVRSAPAAITTRLCPHPEQPPSVAARLCLQAAADAGHPSSLPVHAVHHGSCDEAGTGCARHPRGGLAVRTLVAVGATEAAGPAIGAGTGVPEVARRLPAQGGGPIQDELILGRDDGRRLEIQLAGQPRQVRIGFRTVEARHSVLRGPFGAHPSGQGQRSGPVNRRPAAHSGAGQDGDAQIRGGRGAPIEVEVAEGGGLAAWQVGLGDEWPGFQHQH